MIVDENIYNTLDKASKITLTDYEIKWFDEESGYIDANNLVSIIEDLIYEVDRLEEKIDYIEQDIQDNYRSIPVANQVDISDSDFI